MGIHYALYLSYKNQDKKYAPLITELRLVAFNHCNNIARFIETSKFYPET